MRDLGANYELADSVVQFQPWTQYLRERLPDAPLWNPYQGGGRPFLANAQSAAFSPFTWPSLVLPFWWSLAVVAALKLFAAALGTFLLGRALGMGDVAAFLAGLAFAFGLWFVTWLSWPLDSVWAWLPWLLWLADRVVRRPGPGPVAGLALVIALQFFGGHPESSFHVLAAAALFSLLPLSRAGRAAAPRAIGRLALGLAAGAALAAVAVLPFADLLRHSADLSSRDERQPVTVAFKYVLGLALPEYWGRPTSVISEPFVNARAWYVGALPLLLAGLALLRGGRERLAIAGAALVCLLVATGVQPFFEIAHHVPGFSQSHNTRLGVFVALGLALLAGWGLDDLLRGEARRPRLLAAALAVVVALPVVAVALRAPAADVGEALRVAWGFATPSGDEVLPRAALLIWLPLAGAGALLVWLRAAGRLAPVAFAALALALTGIDLARAGVGQNPAIPVDHAEQPATGAIRYLRSRGRPRASPPSASDQRRPADPAQRRHALRDRRRARLRLSRRAALRDVLGARDRAARPARLHAGRGDRERHAAGAAGARAARRDRRAAGARRCSNARSDPGVCGAGRRRVRQPRGGAAGVRGRAGARGRLGAGRRSTPWRRPASTRGVEAIVERPVGALGGSGEARVDEAAPERMRVTAARLGARRCSSPPTSSCPAGRRPSTAATSRSSASTTCCAACGCRRARTASSSRTRRGAGPRAGS